MTVPTPRLLVKGNPSPTDADPGHYHIYFQPATGALPMRHRTLGFSYFGEVGGLRNIPQDDDDPDPYPKYVTLDGPDNAGPWTTKVSCSSDRTNIRMSFRQWFDMLSEHKINFSRVFVYPDVEPAAYPFKRVDSRHYDLNFKGVAYLDLLRKYIEYAQAKNIVVQISLAGIQTLRPAKWEFHPLNGKPDPNGTFHRNVNGWLNTGDGRTKFAVIKKPAGATPVTEAEKNYVTQSNSLDWILEASSWAWNVIYELFNEPGGADNLVGEVDWLVTTAKWLDERLRDPATNERTHLVSMNAGPDLRNPNNQNIFKPMLFDGTTRRTRPLIDIYSFHGDQWGGDPGHSSRPPLNGPLTREEIKTKTREAVNAFYNQAIDPAGNKIKGSPIALICDSDAHYKAQDAPTRYVRAAVLDLKLSYNHRWGDTWLSQKDLCTQLVAIRDAVP